VNRHKLVHLLKNNIVVAALLLIVAVMALVSNTFLTAANIQNIFGQIAINGIVAFGMTYAIICGEFDLSCGSLLAVVTILFIDLSKRAGIPAAVLVCLLTGFVVGLVNGLLVSKLKISAFVVTLGMMVALKGVALSYTQGKPINYINDSLYAFGNGSLWGIQNIVFFFLIVFVAAEIILRFTKFGRNLYATGGNQTAAKMAGIRVDFYKTSIFVIIGLVTALAGIIMACRTGAGNSLFGGDLSMTVVSAVVIGGSSLSGGRGNAIKTFFGMLVLGVLFNALMILGVQANWQDVIKGAILILVIALDAAFARGRKKLGRA